MSAENVEIVRWLFETFDKGELSQHLELISDDIVVDRGPLGDSYYGKEGLLEAIGDWTAMFEDWSLTAEELIDAGDSVIVRVEQEGRGEGSGAPVTGSFWFVETLRDGKVVRLQMLTSREEALEAAGLSE